MNNERGNIIVYLLVSLALFGVLLGGAWWVKNRAGAAGTPATPVATSAEKKSTPKADQPQTTVNQDATPSQTSGNTSSNTQSQATTPSTSQPSPQTMPPKDDKPTTPRPESQTSSAGSPRAVASSGPVEDSLVTAMLLGTATYTMHSFVRSRRLRKAL